MEAMERARWKGARVRAERQRKLAAVTAEEWAEILKIAPRGTKRLIRAAMREAADREALPDPEIAPLIDLVAERRRRAAE